MPTPLFKVLANAIRLGQPPEPVTAIKALVEVIAHQENELNELRQRISLLSSHIQFLEAKTSRMEVASFQPPPSSGTPYAPEVVMPQRDLRDLQRDVASHREPVHAALSVPQHLPKADPLPLRAEMRGEVRGEVRADMRPEMRGEVRAEMRGEARAEVRVERPRSQLPPPFVRGDDDSSQDEAGGTLVVSRADIDAVVKHVVENEAPFPLSPPGGHRSAEHRSSEPRGDMPFKPAPAQVVSSQLPPQIPPVAPTPAHERRVPDPRGSISDPYVAIEDLVSDDTFSSTAEVAAAAPMPPVPAEPAPRRPVVDEPTFGDEMLTSIHKRNP